MPVLRVMCFSFGGIEHDVARLDRNLAALGDRHAGAREHVDAFLEAVVQCGPRGLSPGFGPANFGEAQNVTREPISPDTVSSEVRPGKPEPLGFRLLETAVPSAHLSQVLDLGRAALHRVELRERSRPPRVAMASAISASMRWPFSTVACCGLPNQPVGAIERMSVSTGW